MSFKGDISSIKIYSYMLPVITIQYNTKLCCISTKNYTETHPIAFITRLMRLMRLMRPFMIINPCIYNNTYLLECTVWSPGYVPS